MKNKRFLTQRHKGTEMSFLAEGHRIPFDPAGSAIVEDQSGFAAQRHLFVPLCLCVRHSELPCFLPQREPKIEGTGCTSSIAA